MNSKINTQFVNKAIHNVADLSAITELTILNKAKISRWVGINKMYLRNEGHELQNK